MRARAFALLAVSALAVSAVAPRPAFAHASLLEAKPGRRAVVASVPARVVLVFTDALEEAFSTVSVFSAGGERVDTGDVRVLATDPHELSVGLPPDLPAGAYTVKYRVLSADGHVVEGSYRFTVKPGP
ncbi:MAG TPA: copper resistance protein CopC [Thermodesulfobacteriota bacterium]